MEEEEIHRDGEVCDCSKCEQAAAESRAEAIAEVGGLQWHEWKAKNLTDKEINNLIAWKDQFHLHT